MKQVIPYQIGDRVLVTHSTMLVYDAQNQRVADATVLREPTVMRVVGAVRRRLGRYNKGHSGDGYFYSEYDPDPPSLKVSGTVLLIQCRTRLFARPIEVQLEHLSQVAFENAQ